MDPLYYHGHHQLHLEDIPFWDDLAQTFGGPVLELGCGTGRVLLPLIQRGHQLTGLDNQQDMLDYMQQMIPPDLAARVQAVQGDMRTFNLDKKFPLVILPCNTFSTFNSSERQQILHSVAAHLAPGGHFVFSIPNPAVIAGLPPVGEPEMEDEFEHPDTGEWIEVISSWQYRKANGIRLLEFTWEYMQNIPGEPAEAECVARATTAHSLDRRAVYKNDLHQCGFKIQAAYGDFDKSLFENDSTYWIVDAALDKGP